MKNRTSFFSFLILTFLIMGNTTAFAGTHWVSPLGTDSWTGCNSTNPPTPAPPSSSTSINDPNNALYCSLATADAGAVPGDLIYVRAGTYNEQIIQPTNNGTAGNMITFKGYPPDIAAGNSINMTYEAITNRWTSTPWTSLNGATVIQSKSTNEEWQHHPSTYFVTTSSGQGITSGNITLSGAGGLDIAACVYSSFSAIHVQLTAGNGSTSVYDTDVGLLPNRWTCFSSGYRSSSGTGGSSGVLTFTSPGTESQNPIPAGTWYVTNVRVNAYTALVNFPPKSYISVQGMTMYDNSSAISMEYAASHNEIAYNDISDMSNYSPIVITGSNGGAPQPGSQYNWVHNNIIHDNGWVQPSGTAGACWENGDALRLGEYAYDDNSIGNLIENNTFYHVGHDHILASTRFNTIRNNVFHNENWSVNPGAILTKYTLEDAFPTQPASYGDNIFNALQTIGFIDSLGHVISQSYGITLNSGTGTGFTVGENVYMYQCSTGDACGSAYGLYVTVSSVDGSGHVTGVNLIPDANGTGYTYGIAQNYNGGLVVNIVDNIGTEFTDPGESATIHSVMGNYNSCGLYTPEPSQAILQKYLGNTAGTTVYNWLVANNYINGSYQTIVNMQSPSILAALQAAFTPNQFSTIVSILSDSYLGARNLLLQPPLSSADNYGGWQLVEGNRFGNSGTPITEGANDIEMNEDNNIIRYNYLWNANASGIEFKPTEGGTNNHDPSDVHVFNNTLYNNGGGVSILGDQQSSISLNSTNLLCSGNVVINNILNNTNRTLVAQNAYGNIATTGFGGTQPLANFLLTNTVSNNDAANDPLFTNIDQSNLLSLIIPDLSFTAQSPEINAAIPLTTVAATDSGSGTQIIVTDPLFFQDSSWAPAGHSVPDAIAVGTQSNVVSIATPGTGLTVNITAATSGTYPITSASVVNGGSGYHVGDIVTPFQAGRVVAGSLTEAASGGTLIVTGISSGEAVTSLGVNTPGTYWTTANSLPTMDETINYGTGTINLSNSISRSPGQPIWLYSVSNGQQVLSGNGPDIGAFDYGASSTTSGIMYGDVNGAANGQVTVYDAELVAQAAVGLITLTPAQQQAAIVSSNTEKQPTIYDAFLIAEYAVGVISEFPAQQGG